MKRKTTTYSSSCIYSCLSKAGLLACLVGALTCRLSHCVSRSKLCIMHYALCIIMTALFSACGHDDLVPPDVYVEEPPTPYVEVRIAIPVANPNATRANPMGGEEGNGRERGIENEDKIHDINVYFYNNEYGMNGEGGIDFHLFYNIKNPNDYLNTKVDSVLETNPKFGEKYLTLKFQYWKEGAHISETSGMKFLAIANAGDLGEIATLKDLRDYILSRDSESNSTWQKTYDAFSMNASKMDYFLMTTAYNDEYTFGGQSTGDNTIGKASNGDYTGTTTLQRMYARLDLWYDKETNAITEGEGENEKVKELKYAVKEATGNTVYLTNVLPVNVMQKPSYLFKKVTNFGPTWNDWSKSTLAGKEDEEKSILESKVPSTLFKWGGKETPDGDGNPVPGPGDYPKNYVMEPRTTKKNTNGGGDVASWYGNTAKSKVMGTSSGDNESGENAYSIRNTTIGKFSDYYSGEPQSETSPNYDCNYVSIISYANENTHPTDCFHSNYLTGMAFRAVYVPEQIFSFDNDKIGTTDESGVMNDTGLISIDGTSSPTRICRYTKSGETQSEAESIYFSSKADAENYSRIHPEDMAVLTEFTAIEHVVGKTNDGKDMKKWGFVCYYNLWLRHYNDENDTKTDPHPHLPMEYATVRNNIYRVAVSFSGPGDPTPTMREPDTMKARIFVRKWNYREESEIIY